MKGRLAIFLTIAVMLVVLVALNAASYVRVEREGDSEFAPDRSTTNAGGTGTRALYEFLEESGYEVSRWERPASALRAAGEKGPATLVVVGEVRRPFEKQEAHALLEWVREGGRLVVIDRRPDAMLLPGSGRWRVSSELVEVPGPDVRPEDVETMTKDAPLISPAQPTLLTRDVDAVTRSRFAGRLRVRSLTGPQGYGPGPAVRSSGAPPPPRPTQTPAVVDDEDPVWEDDEASPAPPPPAPVGGVRAVPSRTPLPPPEVRHDSPAPVEHLSDGREGTGALLVDYAYGRGRVVVLSDPYIISNGGINRADNLILATNVVAGAGGPVAFDEYHQGYGSTSNEFFSYFAGTPILWMFGQVGVILLAVVWTRGRRFARPLPAPRVDRRSKLEFVASMAELQQRSRSYDLAVENIYARTRRALARYGGVAADAPPEQIAARVAARSGKDARRIEKLLRECEDAVHGEPLTPRRALSLARSLRELERELGILMRSREIRQAEAR